ncbi:MAG: tRNA (adenosine(37)-N6)-threonylcarbamoyltransferase complex ATPase subunit type 1 TsaE [Clostridia bacterium]|nr:tRNA (adenosine(37)-N6)-threonylcarbamoyltransferase complex ATPase subunit type 1 TsaE [Clostridia bacterium]
MEKVFVTNSAQETRDLGKELSPLFSGVCVAALYGDLGAGKTAFVSGVAEGFSCMQRATSPTYTIVNEYYGKRRICHFDMYRLSGADALFEIGWEDYLSSGALIIVEWSERIEEAIPENAVRIYFEKLSENSRRITVKIADTLA